MQGLAKQSDKYMGEVIKLPSNYQFGDEVCLSFGTGPLIPKCHITKVIFTRTKVLYDVEIPIYEPGETDDGYLPTCVGHTRIHSVDSAFVNDFDYGRSTVIKKWYHRSDHPDTEALVECRYIGSAASDSVGPNFFARFKFDGNGFEWFNEQNTPICDAVQFEWTEINKPGKTVKDFVKEREILKQVEEMCLESLAPDEYEEWNKILNIIRTRRHHA